MNSTELAFAEDGFLMSQRFDWRCHDHREHLLRLGMRLDRAGGLPYSRDLKVLEAMG
jgi:hypothetical protein